MDEKITIALPWQKREAEKGQESNFEEATKSKMAKSNEEETISKDSFKEDGDRKMTTTRIHQLSDDVLIEIIKSIPIFQWPSLEGVDRKFREAVYESWRSVKKINLDEDLIGDRLKIESNKRHEALNSILDKLVRRAPNISSIAGFRIFGQNPFDDESLRSLTKFKLLERIDLSQSGQDLGKLDLLLENVASRCRLKELNADSCYFELIQHRRQIEETNFLVQRYRLFENIDLSALTTLDDAWFCTMDDDLVDAIVRSPNLERLSLNIYCDHRGDPCDQAYYYGQLFQSVGNLKNLKALRITGTCHDCTTFRGRFLPLANILGRRRCFSELSLLNPTFCMDDDVVEAIVDNLTNLTSLEFCVDHCTSQRLAHLISQLTKLENLKFRCLWHARSSEEEDDDDQVVSAITSNLPQLKLLYLDIPNRPSTTLGSLSKLENLKELYIFDCPLQDAILVSWSERLSKLETLRLVSCQVSDDGFVALIRKLDNLRRLDLDQAVVTDRSLQAIVESCPNLRQLDLTGCTNITLQGIQELVDGCPELKYLNLEEKWRSDEMWVREIMGSRVGDRWVRELKTAKYRKININLL